MNKFMIVLLALCMPRIVQAGLAFSARPSQSMCSDRSVAPERLFPLSPYGQAVELCMRVMSDQQHCYDAETAADLCVGRLCRLAQAVKQMERRHMAQQKYCQEDVAYILGLMGIVCKERVESFAVNTLASSLFKSIESSLALLLRYP